MPRPVSLLHTMHHKMTAVKSSSQILEDKEQIWGQLWAWMHGYVPVLNVDPSLKLTLARCLVDITTVTVNRYCFQLTGIQTSAQEICNCSIHEYILIITHQQTPMQQQWNNVCADNCIQFLWGIHPKPPQADCEVKVETSPTITVYVRVCQQSYITPAFGTGRTSSPNNWCKFH